MEAIHACYSLKQACQTRGSQLNLLCPASTNINEQKHNII